MFSLTTGRSQQRRRLRLGSTHCRLGEFKVWLQEVYLPEKYPAYVAKKTREGAIDASRATLLLSALSPGANDEEDEE